jgi:hypothetical protein
MIRDVRVVIGCAMDDWPPVVRRIVLDRLPLAIATPYLAPVPPGPDDVVISQPQLAGAALLGQLARDGHLPGPEAFQRRAAAFLEGLDRWLREAAATEGRPTAARRKVHRRIWAQCAREALAVLAEAEGVFPG